LRRNKNCTILVIDPRTETTMNVSIGPHWEAFVDELVRSGRFGSASEVIRHGLRQVEVEEAKLKALREGVAAALAEDQWYTPEEAVEAVTFGLHENAPEFRGKT
jgi:antitoxin ParD1/3/4